jgi:hypothetical protein
MFWVAKFDSRRGSWFGFPVPRDIATEYRKSSTKASIQWGKKKVIGASKVTYLKNHLVVCMDNRTLRMMMVFIMTRLAVMGSMTEHFL